MISFSFLHDAMKIYTTMLLGEERRLFLRDASHGNHPHGPAIVSPLQPQRQEGHTQRFIREVNTTSRSCVLWDLEEETDYVIQVQSIGLYGESQATKKVHFRTLKKTDRFPSNSSNQGELLGDTGN